MTDDGQQAYTARLENDGDVAVTRQGRVWRMWGRDSARREQELAAGLPEGGLPVLVGSGLGVALGLLAARGPVAVVDREDVILDLTGLRERFASDPNVFWVRGEGPAQALEQLTGWQVGQGGGPFVPLVCPLYLRLDPDWYRAVLDGLAASRQADFWGRARYPKFRSAKPRVLFFSRPYFLVDEIRAGLARLGLPFCEIPVGLGDTARPGFVEELLSSVLDFRPDFVLTVNHFGMDREGRLAALLDSLDLPLASWFVDSPHLILHEFPNQASGRIALFTWDADTVEDLMGAGFAHVAWLPLATDPHRFRPGLGTDNPEAWRSNVSFVGNSMRRAVDEALQRLGLAPGLNEAYASAAAAFMQSGERTARVFLEKQRPDLWGLVCGLPDAARRLAFESLITWEATRLYRLDCVRRLLPFEPVVAGDAGWRDALPGEGWRALPPLDYFSDLPRFYPAAKVNFNCTSRQMKGAVNQRVFDVPACGAFVLSDSQPQMDELFEPGLESACYRSPEEIGDAVARWIADDAGRARVSERARRRILAEHTYERRLLNLVEVMRRTFGG